MTLTDAIYPKSTIISAEDLRDFDPQYRIGDRLLFSPKDISEYDFPEGVLNEGHMIICICGYMLFDEGDLGYAAQIIEPEEQPYIWGLRKEEIEQDFVYIGDSIEDSRFLHIGS